MNYLYGVGAQLASLVAPDAPPFAPPPVVPPLQPPPPPPPVSVDPACAVANTVTEALVHLAEGRPEMAVLMVEQADADLARLEAGALDSTQRAALAVTREVQQASALRVRAAVQSDLVAAVERHSGGDIARFCKLLCMLHQADEAYETLYNKHLLHTLAQAIGRVERDLVRGVDRTKAGFYIAGASHVFQLLLDLISDHEGLLMHQFGVVRFFDTLLALQQRVDAFAGTLFAAFSERRVQPLVTTVDSAALGALSAALDEMTRLSLRCEIFSQGIDEAAHRALSYTRSTGQSSVHCDQAYAQLTSRLLHSQVRRGNMEAMSSYVLLEQRTLERSLLLTRQVAFVDVDAFFFVLDRSAQRALASCNVTIACSIVSTVATHVDIELLQWLREAWQGPASMDATLLRDVLHRTAACVLAATQLRVRLEAVAHKYFPRDERALEKLLSCLSSVAPAVRALEREGRDMARRHMTVVMEPVLRRLNALGVDDLHSVQGSMADLLRVALADAKPGGSLHGAAGSWMLGVAAEDLVAALLARVAALRFTQAQALQFQGIVQALHEAFQSFEQCVGLETAFSRLRLTCVVLVVDAVVDVAELWTPQWPLSVSEVRQVLARRREFAGADVARLKLATGN